MDGDIPAISDHAPLSRKELRRLLESPGSEDGALIEFSWDDGNGLWYSVRETPIYLGLSRAYGAPPIG